MRRYLQLLLFLLLASSVSAQIVNQFSVADNVTVCDPLGTTLTINITNDTTRRNQASIGLSLGVGVEILPGQVNVINGQAVVQTNADPNNPVFSLGSLDPGATVEFQLKLTGTCDARSHKIAGGIFSADLSFFDAGTPVPMVGQTNLIYDVIYAALSVSNVTNTPPGVPIGQTLTREVLLTNGSFGAIDSFLFAEIFQPGQLVFSNFVLDPGGQNIALGNGTLSQGGDSVVLIFDPALVAQFPNTESNPLTFEEDEQVILQYQIQVTGCGLQGGVPSRPTVYYGCGGTVCQSNDNLSIITLPPNEPDLVVTYTENLAPCYGSGNPLDTILITLDNQGFGAASNPVLEVNYIWEEYIGLNPNITYQVENGPVQSLSMDERLRFPMNNNFGCLDDYTGTDDLFARIQDTIPVVIAPGQKVFVRVPVFKCCPSCLEDARANLWRPGYRINGGVTYTNLCGGNVTRTATRGLARQLQTKPTYNVPTTFQNNDTLKARIDFPALTVLRIPMDLSTMYFELKANLPDCIRLAGSDTTIKWFLADSTELVPYFTQVVNDTLIARWRWAGNSAGTSFNANGSWLEFPLTLDCGLAPCPDRGFQIDFNMVPSTNCTRICAVQLACFDRQVALNCPGPCTGFAYRNYLFERENIGLPDMDNNGCPDDDNDCDGAGALASVAFDPDLIDRNRALSGDTILQVVEGIIAAGNGPPLSWTYLYSDDLCDADALSLYTTEVHLTDGATGQTYVCTQVPFVRTPTGYNYDLSIAAIANCAGWPKLTYDVGDSITTISRYVVTNNIPLKYTLYDFDNNTYLADVPNPTSSVNRFACGSVFELLGAVRPTPVQGNRNEIQFNGCESLNDFRNTYLLVSGAHSGNNFFPNEYRQIARPIRAEYTLPPGWSLDSARFSIQRTGGQNVRVNQPFSAIVPSLTLVRSTGAQTLIFDLEDSVNSKIFVENGGDVYLSDDGFRPFVEVYISPGCAADISWDSRVPGNVLSPRLFYRLNDGSEVTAYNYSRIYFQKPAVLANSANEIQAGQGTDLSTDFAITNVSSLARANNTWVYIQTPSGNIGQNTLKLSDNLGNEITPNAGGIYELGDLDLGQAESYGLTVDYNGCDKDSVYVLYGWNCGGYPMDPASIACKDTLTLFFEPPVTAISATISPLALTPSDPTNALSPAWGKDSVTMCEGFPIEISIVAAQEGNVFDVSTNLLNPDSDGTFGLEYDFGSAYVEYPEGTTPRPFSQAAEMMLRNGNGTASFPMDLAIIDASNFGSGMPLSGINDLSRNKVILRMRMKPTCDITGGESFRAETFGSSSCGEPAVGDGETVQGFAVAIEGAPRPYITIIDLEGDLVACNNALGMVTTSILKFGATPSASSDIVDILMPSNLVPVVDATNPIVCKGQFCPSNPKVVAIPGQGNALRVNFPAGMLNLDSMVFSFAVRVNDPASCTSTSASFQARTLSPSIISCKGVPCPNFFNLTGASTEVLSIRQPDLYLANVNAASVCGSLGREFTFTATVANRSGDIPPSIPIMVDIWKDVNQDGVVDSGDRLIKNLSTFSASLPKPFQVLSYFQSVNALSDVSPMIVVLKGCICDTLVVNIGNLVEQCGVVGDFVWNDQNANGIQETGEPGVPGIDVTLTTCAGVPVMNTKTDSAGAYLFTDVPPGSYYVSFGQIPIGFQYTLEDQGGNDFADSDATAVGAGLFANTPCFTLNPGDSNLSLDLGIFNPDSIPATQLACVGDRVWEDVFPDGRQNFGEPGLGGVEVRLLDRNENFLQSTLTDSLGLYRFDSLVPGKYYIQITTFPVSYRLARLNVGADPGRDSDIDPATGLTSLITLQGGACDLSWDAGFFRTCEELCDVEDYQVNNGASLFLYNSTLLPEYKMVPGTGSFNINSAGEAVLTGIVQNEFFANQRFRMEIYLNNRRNWVQWSRLGRDYKVSSTVPANAYLGWDFFELDSTRSRLYGEGAFAGDTIFMSHMPANYNYGFQYGYGANGLSSEIGLGGWLFYRSASGNYSGAGDVFINVDCQQDCSNSPFFFAPTAKLEGAYDHNTGLMRTALQQTQLLPASQPFNAQPWNYQGSETYAGTNATVVDWMLLETRHGSYPDSVVGQQAVLIHADGVITKPDGKAISLDLAQNIDSFYVVFKHRNHLSVMTQKAFSTTSGIVEVVDLTDIQQVYTNPTESSSPVNILVNGDAALIQGDQSSDDQINSLDLGGVMNSYFMSGMRNADVNLDGVTNSIDVARAFSNYFRRSHAPE